MNIIQNQNNFSVADVTATHEKLPKGVYLLKQDPQSLEYYLTKKDDFVIPDKLYGEFTVDRWLKSWENNTQKNLGILMQGLKGSGKTIEAQMFCIKSELPVIMISEPFHGTGFIDFITNPILGSCIIFIDEFEKVYGEQEHQKDLLSVMDGQYPTSLIFLLTVNKDIVNEYLVNRLNRIKYKKEYLSLDKSIIEDVCLDMLNYPEYKESIYEFFKKVNICTFDILVNLIKEINLFNEDAITCGKHLNLGTERILYEVVEIYDGKEYKQGEIQFIDNGMFEIYRKDFKYLSNNEYMSISLGYDDADGEYFTIEELSGGVKHIKAFYENEDAEIKEYNFRLTPSVKSSMLF